MKPLLQEIEVNFSTSPSYSVSVGILVMQQNRLFFEYDTSWLQKGLELSPFILPCKPGLTEHKALEFGTLFGLFDDSLPDGWGLLLMDRHFRSLGVDPVTISPLDRLLYLGVHTMGALTYHPPESLTGADSTINLHDLAIEAMQVYTGATREVLPLLLRTGGSPGGARPKVLVGFNKSQEVLIAGEGDLSPGYEHWLIKFAGREDGFDSAQIEYAYAEMATAAGVEMPEFRLFHTKEGEQFFGVKRFDRKSGNRRVHVHTFGNLIQANFRIPSCDYSDFLKVTTLLCRNYADVKRAFRLMVFNILAHNRDDHVKNFSFLLNDQDGSWTLAPAYDLTFSPGPGGEHSTTVAGHGRNITKSHCLELAEKYDLEFSVAVQIIGEVEAAVERWPSCAAEAGVGEVRINDIAKKLADLKLVWSGSLI